MAVLRSSAATVSASRWLMSVSSVACRRCWVWRRALASATPVCSARTRSRNCSAAVGSASALTARKPKCRPRLRSGKAHPHSPWPTAMAPPAVLTTASWISTSARTCAVSGTVRCHVPAVVGKVGANEPAASERRDRRSGQAQDLLLVLAVGHPHGQSEQCLQVRQLLAQRQIAPVPPDVTGRLIAWPRAHAKKCGGCPPACEARRRSRGWSAPRP